MTPSIQTLFNSLTDGLAIIGRDGRVRFCNEAMSRLLPVTPQSQFPLSSVTRLIEQATAGHLPLPHRFETLLEHDPEVADPDCLVGHIVHSPVGGDLILVLNNVTEAESYDVAIANLSALIERTLLAPLEQFAQDFESLLNATSGAWLPVDPTLQEKTISKGRELIKQLQMVSNFVQVSRASAVTAMERIELNDWLIHCLSEHTVDANKRGVRLTLTNDKEASQILYGSKHWLSKALGACLENAIEHSDHGAEIVVSVTSLERFIRVDIRNHGRKLRSPMLRRRLSKPFVRGRLASAKRPALGLGLPLARSIIEMHRGRLSLEQDLDGFVTCKLELPISDACSVSMPDMQEAQALRYARDLARLMAARRHVGADVSA